MYILFRPSDSDIISNIVDYLDYLGYNLTPNKYICNKTFVIQTESGEIYIGEKECIRFFSDLTLISHLSEKAQEFKKYNKIKYKIE